MHSTRTAVFSGGGHICTLTFFTILHHTRLHLQSSTTSPWPQGQVLGLKHSLRTCTMALASRTWCTDLGLDNEGRGLDLDQLLSLFMVIWHRNKIEAVSVHLHNMVDKLLFSLWNSGLDIGFEHFSLGPWLVYFTSPWPWTSSPWHQQLTNVTYLNVTNQTTTTGDEYLTACHHFLKYSAGFADSLLAQCPELLHIQQFGLVRTLWADFLHARFPPCSPNTDCNYSVEYSNNKPQP